MKSNSDRGLFSEIFVLLYFAEKKYQLVHHGMRTPFGEADLILRAPDGQLVVIEVKTVQDDRYFETRIKPEQLRRLKNICGWVFDRYLGKDSFPSLQIIFANAEQGRLYFFEAY